MKLWKRMVVSAALVLALAVAPVAGASVQTVTAQLRPDYTILIDGAARTFYNVVGTEVHPIAYSGTIYLPLRAIGELMGRDVAWNEDTLTATLTAPRTTAGATGTPDRQTASAQVSVTLRPDFTILIDGQRRTFADVNGKAVYPLLYSGSIYLPLRAIGQIMGKQASWDAATNTAALTGGSLVTDADIIGTPSPTPAPTSTPAPTPAPTPAATGKIGADRAKEIALGHAGLTADRVTFFPVKEDYEKGRRVYEVEFYTQDGREYDYEIDALTGAVLSYDQDIEGYTPVQTGTQLTAAQAKEIALKQVPGATAANLHKCKLDREDGRWIYEVELVYNGREYEFEIDAYSGAILSQEIE